MQISLCSFGDSSFSFPALCLGISGRCAFLFRFVLPRAMFAAARARPWHARRRQQCEQGDRGSQASQARGTRAGSTGALTQGTRHLLPTLNPPLRL